MDFAKIKTLIDFVGRSNITELSVTERETSVRIFRFTGQPVSSAGSVDQTKQGEKAMATAHASVQTADLLVTAPVFGILHVARVPGEAPFVGIGDVVEEGQTLFIIEAMKIFNKVTAPRAGRIVRLRDVEGAEVEAGEMLAEIE